MFVVSTTYAVAKNSITALEVSSVANGVTVIRVETAEPLANLPAGFTVNTPPRIALDFPNTTNALGQTTKTFVEGSLRSANIIQAGNRTRLVINLSEMLTYETKIDGNNLLISLLGRSVDVAAGEGRTSRFAEAGQEVSTHSLRDIDFRRGKNGEGRIRVDLSDSGVGIDIRQQGAALIVDFLKSSLPGNLQRKLDVVDFATPVQRVDTFARGDSVRMVIEPKGLWEHVAYQTGSQFIIEVKAVVEDPNKLVKGNQLGYAGEKLTLNFQKIDVREALNVIADFTDLNVVISDTVGGNLTLRLKDVPWDQALDIILESKGLDMRKNGNVIQVAPREEIAAKEKLNLGARNDIAELEELRTESFQLSYQTGGPMIKILSDEKQRILSSRGSVVSDPRTNTLFVKDTPSHLEDVRRIIRQIDVPVRQVLIEARFVSAGDAFNRDLGVRLGYQSNDTFKVGNGGGNIGANIVPAGGALSGNSVNINTPNVNLPVAGAAGTFSMMLFNSGLSKLLSVELTASELDGKTKNIASPRVVTADKTEATISTGVQIPYQEASSSGASTIAFKDATLSLKVTPHITPDDRINMKLDVNQDTVGVIFSGIPSINTRKVSTEVLVESGGTVVIGGVYTQAISNTTNKVPLLGDVPVLGALFRSNAKSDVKSELLIFITPRIVDDAMTLR
jgi:type IV pilus assembly protein PilQ